MTIYLAKISVARVVERYIEAGSEDEALAFAYGLVFGNDEHIEQVIDVQEAS